MAGYIAEIWKINLILDVMKRTDFSRFRIPGFTDFNSKTFRFAGLLGFNRKDIYDVITELTHLDYVQGPLADDKGRPSDLWVFGSYIEAFEVYIKIVAHIRNEFCETICVSFHEAERPLTYPYRKAA